MSNSELSTIEIGVKIPPIALPATGGQTINLADFIGQSIVLYFYPKDSTPGCTTESIDFTTHYADFTAANCVIFGISRDSLKSHEKFKAKYAMPFELLSDADENVCRLFDVIKMKNMYGKQYEGIERSTFLIDANGVLQRVWRKVRVKEHVAEVLAAVQSL